MRWTTGLITVSFWRYTFARSAMNAGSGATVSLTKYPYSFVTRRVAVSGCGARADRVAAVGVDRKAERLRRCLVLVCVVDEAEVRVRGRRVGGTRQVPP